MELINFDRRYRLRRRGWSEGLKFFNSSVKEMMLSHAVIRYLNDSQGSWGGDWDVMWGWQADQGCRYTMIVFRDPGMSSMVLLSLDHKQPWSQ